MTTYSIIVADPPWAPRDKLPGPKRGAAKQYQVLDTPKICSFLDDIGLQVADVAILFLWRLSSMQRDALDVAEAWGFSVKSEIVWCKMTKRGLNHFGMGRTVRGSHETCLIAHRGRANSMIKSHSIRSTFSAPLPTDAQGRIIHSAKPDEFFSIVDELTGGSVPRIELFARRYRATWDVHGNQL